MLADFLTREAHHVELVLELIEVEHVADKDRSLVDGGIEGERSIERDVGARDLQLQVQDEVVECRVAKEAVAGVDAVLEHTNLTIHEVVDFLNLWLEMCHECFVDGLIDNIDEVALDVFRDNFALSQRYLHLCICNRDGIVGGIETGDGLAFTVHDH